MHFNGDLIQAVTCTKDAIALVRSGDYTSKALYDHVLFALGHFNALRPEVVEKVVGDAPADLHAVCDELDKALPADNYFGADYFAIAQLLFQLFQMLRSK